MGEGEGRTVVRFRYDTESDGRVEGKGEGGCDGCVRERGGK